MLGDACNFFTFMFFDYCTPIETYRKNLLTLKSQLAGKIDHVLLSHGNGSAPTEILDGVIDVCDDILAGNTDDIPFTFRGESALIAKAIAGTWSAHGRRCWQHRLSEKQRAGIKNDIRNM